MKCYETSENEFARERFNRALDANRTNYFAYQYLGFIAVNADDSKEAIKNFDQARKFGVFGSTHGAANTGKYYPDIAVRKHVREVGYRIDRSE